MFFKSYNPHINCNYIPSLETGKFAHVLFREDTCLLACLLSPFLYSVQEKKDGTSLFILLVASQQPCTWKHCKKDGQTSKAQMYTAKLQFLNAGYLLIMFLSEVPHRHSNSSHSHPPSPGRKHERPSGK